MRRTALFALLALTGASCAHNDAALWDKALTLREPTRATEAETALRKAGPEGYAVLVKMARAGGDDAALQAATSDVRCPFGPGGGPPHRNRMLNEPAPFWHASKLAAQLLFEDTKLRERALASPEPFDRSLAIASTQRDTGVLLETLAKLENESDLQVLTTAEQALRCARFTPSQGQPKDLQALEELARKFSDRVKAHQPKQSCDASGSVGGELLEGMAKGTWRVSGWGSSNEDFSVRAEGKNGQRMSLTPSCALALYDALEQRGVYVQGLVVPLSTEGTVPVGLRKEAGRRAVRDLAHYPEQERNRLAAQLVNAGHSVQERIVVKKEDTFTQEAELEAARRQGQPGTEALIERHVFCRGTFGSSGIALLGYVATPQAAETAWQLAAQCPRALGDATAALLRREDPRALELLGRALQDPGFSRDALMRAALEHYTPAPGQKLQALEAEGVREAADFRKRLRVEGVLVE